MNESFPPGPLVASGRRADVYTYQPDRVIKFLKPGYPPDWLEEESRRSLALSAAGLPVPHCYGLVEIDGRLGLVYEDAGQRSLQQVLTAQPWKAAWAARQVAAVQAALLAVSPPGLTSLHELVGRRIQASPVLSDTQKAAALGALERLPVGGALCHGDLHPGNVLISARGPLVIDWDNVSAGPPAADIARSLLLIYLPPGFPWLLIAPFVAVYRAVYRREIQRLVPLDAQVLAAWLPVMAAARTVEGISEQQEWLMKRVRAAFGG